MTSFDINPFQRYFDARDANLGNLSLGTDATTFLRNLAGRAQDSDALERYANACPVPGASPADYAPRLVQLSASCSVIASIHFRGLDLSFPFVDVSAQTADLPTRLELLFESFALFEPKAVRIWQSPSDPLPDSGRRDLDVVAGHIPSVLSRPPPATSSCVSLMPDPNLDSYDDYVLTYQALHELHPDIANMAQPEDRTSLAVCAETNSYFMVFVDSVLAGFVAARPDSFRLWTGWCMVEQVLKPSFRGRGLAPVLQRLLLERLDLSTNQHVFGTIDARNTPSSRTALRNGRQLVELSTFVPR